MCLIDHLCLHLRSSHLLQDANIQAGLSQNPSESEFDDADRSIKAALGLSMICFFLAFFGLFSGVSLFFGRVSFLHIVCHFVGGLTTSWFIIDEWHYQTYWYIYAFCSLIPAIAEVIVLFFTFVLKVIEY